MDTLLKIFAENVQARREKAGWSQAELAEKADISTASVQAVELKVRFPRLKTRKGIASAFKCPEWHLFLPPGTEVGANPSADDAAELLRLFSSLKQHEARGVLETLRERVGVKQGTELKRDAK